MSGRHAAWLACDSGLVPGGSLRLQAGTVGMWEVSTRAAVHAPRSTAALRIVDVAAAVASGRPVVRAARCVKRLVMPDCIHACFYSLLLRLFVCGVQKHKICRMPPGAPRSPHPHEYYWRHTQAPEAAGDLHQETGMAIMARSFCRVLIWNSSNCRCPERQAQQDGHWQFSGSHCLHPLGSDQGSLGTLTSCA